MLADDSALSPLMKCGTLEVCPVKKALKSCRKCCMKYSGNEEGLLEWKSAHLAGVSKHTCKH